MFEIDIEQWVPRFLLKDRNGRACARAIEAGLNAMNRIVAQGVSWLTDPDAMPEWRLDEMAWELNCLYDYGADIASKRAWIRSAAQDYALYGTLRAIYNYLSGAFDDVLIEEYWAYGGQPFHFRASLSGAWTQARESWVRQAIEAAKPVRSVMDTLSMGSRARIRIRAGEYAANTVYFPLCGQAVCGLYPVDADNAPLDIEV